jgi:hypothetical protein
MLAGVGILGYGQFMDDFIFSIFLPNHAQLEDAAQLIAGVLVGNEAVSGFDVHPMTDEDDPMNRWLSVSGDWDPAAAERINDDHKLEELCDQVSPIGLRRLLDAAQISVDEIMAEYA